MRHHVKSIFAAIFFSAIFIYGIAAGLLFLDWNTNAYSACQLSLPQNTVSMKVYADNASCDQLPTSFSGYVSTTFSNIPDGSSILNNTSYAGLCADLEGYVLDFTSSNATYQVQLLSSADNPTFAGRPWDKINYILNHTSQYNWLDVQTAIWQLMYPNTSESPYGCNVNQTNVQNIVADANANGGGFVPGNDNLFAIIVSPLSCAGNSSNYCCYPPDCTHLPLQLLFTAATCSASYTVLPSAGGGGSIAPSTPQTVNHSATTSFTVAPDTGYHAVMSGTCGGNLVGNTYTTNPVTADCTVTASFAIDTHTVTPSAGAHGTINPSTAQTVNYNATPSFTVTANAGYLAVMSGTCGGTLDGNTYTTNPITADCTVNASFAVAAPLTITTASLPTGTVLVPYSQALTATGGILPYSWSVSAGSLPNALNLNSSTGEISGTPSTSGTFNFTAQVADATSSTAVKNLSISTEALPVRYGDPGTPITYDHIIQSAYDHCADGYIIEVQDLAFTEDIICDRNVSVTLKGGFDQGFTNNPSFTMVQGKLTVRDGTVVIENIIIK